MVAYVVEGLEDVTLDKAGATGPLAGSDLMSPFVWTEGRKQRILVRVVPNPLKANDVTGIIWGGDSTDGLTFRMRSQPAIAPGDNGDDAGGCEDPTVVHGQEGKYLIFYTGVDKARQQGSLLVAEGPDLTDLTRRRVMLKAPKSEGNIKEATLAQRPDGGYILFYEYARANASRIGAAIGEGPEGPWKAIKDPFTVREEGWDNWHLSTGPIVQRAGEDPVMFYNGATIDARWRIGWISFSPDFSSVTGRGVEPLLMPPPVEDRTATDIAFAASCLVEDDIIYLYYSLEDRILKRALVKTYR